MLKIKLSRRGKKKYPTYRLIISEVGRDPYGDNLEILGNYNPHTKELVVKADRIKYWLDKGAQMTDTINNLLVGQKIIEGKKVAVSKLTKKSRETLAKKETDAKMAAEKAAADQAAAEVSSVAKAMEDKKAAETAAAPVEATPTLEVTAATPAETTPEAPAEE